MARHTLPIDALFGSSYRTLALLLVHLVTTRASDAAAGVTTLDTSDVRRFIAVACQTSFIDAHCRELRRVDDVIGGRRLDVRTRRAVAALASMPFLAALGPGLEDGMRVLLKEPEHVFMARLARVRPDVSFGSRRILPLSYGSGEQN
jgi:hypothetical protein